MPRPLNHYKTLAQTIRVSKTLKTSKASRPAVHRRAVPWLLVQAYISAVMPSWRSFNQTKI
eukprot:scaffold119118_cov21-Prasinocladus_malaysianus.AAC.1